MLINKEGLTYDVMTVLWGITLDRFQGILITPNNTSFYNLNRD